MMDMDILLMPGFVVEMVPRWRRYVEVSSDRKNVVTSGFESERQGHHIRLSQVLRQ